MIVEHSCDSDLFADLLCPMLQQGLDVRFQARGASMSPAIRDGEVVEITPVQLSQLRKGDIVLAKTELGFRLHRIVNFDLVNNVFITRGDCGHENDPPLSAAQILGLARAKEVRLGWTTVRASFRYGSFLRCAARVQYLLEKMLRKPRPDRIRLASR